MMQVVPFDLAHFDQIEWQDAQAFGQALYQREWAEEIAASSDAWSAVAEDGYIVACAGVIPTRLLRQVNGPDIPQESLAWAIFSPRLMRHAKDVVRAISAFLDGRGEYRIEAFVDGEHERAGPFLEHLGFRFERETHAEEIGKTLRIYARVRQ